MKLNDLKNKLIAENSKFKEEYQKEDLAFGIARLISNFRSHNGLTQEKLAKLIKTKQSGISRLERGNNMPSLTLLKTIADKFRYKIQIRFVSLTSLTTFDSDGRVFDNHKVLYTDSFNSQVKSVSTKTIVESGTQRLAFTS